MLYRMQIETPLGAMVAVAADEGLCLLEFADRPELAAELAFFKRRLDCEITDGKSADRPATHPVLQAIAEDLREYFTGKRRKFTTPIRRPLLGTEFQQSIWDALVQIPYGETRSYGELARSIGKASAVRAVGAANGANRMAIIFPCHRVIGGDGSLTGYAGGIERKRRLLELEGALRA